VEPDPDGTVRLSIAPPASGLSRASGSVPTVAGPAAVSWQRHGRGIALSLTVPANASAAVQLPASDPAGAREGGVAVSRAPGVSVLPTADGRAVLSVGSGTYRFTTS